MPHLDITEVVLIHCNNVNNDYQHDLIVFYIFVPNKSFGQLLDITPKKIIFLKTFNSEFLYIEVCFTDQNSKLLEIEDKVNIILVINLVQNIKYQIFVKRYGFLLFAKNMGKNIDKNISKNLRGKYNQKLLDHAKKSATDALETTSKRAIQKTAEASGDLIGNKIANRITKVSKYS